jgi:hypothetical protein
LGSGAIAAIVIIVLLSFIAALGFFVLWRTRQAEVRKFLGLRNQEMPQSPRRGNDAGDSGFENLAYDANNTEADA